MVQWKDEYSRRLDLIRGTGSRFNLHTSKSSKKEARRSRSGRAACHHAARHNAARHNAARHNTARHNAARHNAARHNAARHNAARHNAPRRTAARGRSFRNGLGSSDRPTRSRLQGLADIEANAGASTPIVERRRDKVFRQLVVERVHLSGLWVLWIEGL